MDSTLSGPARPKFRRTVRVAVGTAAAEITLDGRECAFEFPDGHAQAVSRLLVGLESGGFSPAELQPQVPEIAADVPPVFRAFHPPFPFTPNQPKTLGRGRRGPPLSPEGPRPRRPTRSR